MPVGCKLIWLVEIRSNMSFYSMSIGCFFAVDAAAVFDGLGLIAEPKGATVSALREGRKPTSELRVVSLADVAEDLSGSFLAVCGLFTARRGCLLEIFVAEYLTRMAATASAAVS